MVDWDDDIEFWIKGVVDNRVDLIETAVLNLSISYDVFSGGSSVAREEIGRLQVIIASVPKQHIQRRAFCGWSRDSVVLSPFSFETGDSHKRGYFESLFVSGT